MNASTETRKADGLSLTQTIVGLLRHYLGGRRGIIVLAVAAGGAGLFLGWGWLAAVGVAPLLLALAPCAAMCALGPYVRDLLDLWRDRNRKSAAVKAMAAHHIETLDRKIEELHFMRKAVADLVKRCRGDSRPDCPILDDLEYGK